MNICTFRFLHLYAFNMSKKKSLPLRFCWIIIKMYINVVCAILIWHIDWIANEIQGSYKNTIKPEAAFHTNPHKHIHHVYHAITIRVKRSVYNVLVFIRYICHCMYNTFFYCVNGNFVFCTSFSILLIKQQEAWKKVKRQKNMFRSRRDLVVCAFVLKGF